MTDEGVVCMFAGGCPVHCARLHPDVPLNFSLTVQLDTYVLTKHTMQVVISRPFPPPFACVKMVACLILHTLLPLMKTLDRVEAFGRLTLNWQLYGSASVLWSTDNW